MSFWSRQKVVVTGGSGFIGSHLVGALRREGCTQVFVARSRDYDLTKEDQCTRLLEDTSPDIVFHLAGLVGGIGANLARPADFFYRNLTMGTFMLHRSWSHGVQKLVAAGAGCGYPEHAPAPLNEATFHEGLPQVESAPYGLAKRVMHIQSQAYQQQYGFVSIVGLPGNVYGPSDNFDLEASHVVPALVRKFIEAVERGADTVTVWGTGLPTRDFVYVGDVARGLLLAAERYDRSALVNLSSGEEASIHSLADLIAELTGFQGEIVWDTTRPDGQARRLFDVQKARQDLQFEAKTSLREGLTTTIEWYRRNALSLV